MSADWTPIGRHMLTDGVQVVTRRERHLLGRIEWNARWRQWEFVPAGDHVAFTWDCLQALAGYLALRPTDLGALLRHQDLKQRNAQGGPA